MSLEIIDEYTKHIRAFESLMRTKGYGYKFEITMENRDRLYHTGTLKECLEAFLSKMKQDGITISDFSLTTPAEFLSAQNYKECHFAGTFDTTKGFVVKRLTIESKFPDEVQQLRLRNNNEIPGKNTVIGRFRKPKPWEREMRGDFRHRWRR